MSALIKATELPGYMKHPDRTVRRLRKLPDFPRARDLTGSGKCLVYIKAEIDAWLAGLPPAEVRPEPKQLEAGRLARQQAEHAAAAATAEREAATT